MKKWWSYIQNKYIFATVLFMIYSLFLDDVDIFTIVNHNRKLNKLEVSKMETAHKLDSTQHLLETLRYDDQLESFAREHKLYKKEDEDIFVISKE
jgi:cell division protein DivIC